MLSASRRAFRVLATLLLLAAAVFAGVLIWQHYLIAPWTRDGTVEAYVINLAPEVSGRVVKLQVKDNDVVHSGDVLYEIDPVDFQIAIASAEATVASRKSDMESKENQAQRRGSLTTLTTSKEEQQTYQSTADMARAAYAGAIAQLNQTRIDLDRTQVRSPVNGFVTNLQLRAGDYATKGTRNIAIVDTDSFWISGNFEETKLARIKPGDPAVAQLLGFEEPVYGHVDSIARGINTPNSAPGTLGLASVNPVFTWVRLAQRLTATVSVGPEARAGSLHGWLSRVLTMGGG